MKTVTCAAAIALLLCACSPTTSTDEKPTAPVAATAPADTAAAPVTAQTPEPTQSAAAEADSAPAQSIDGNEANKAVNDAIDSNLGDHSQYESAIATLQKAVAAGDASTVAGLVDYPISVEIKGNDTIIKSADMFVARYSDFMTPEISKAIIDTEYKDLFVNYKGVMFGSGQAWVNGICKDNDCKSFDVRLVTLQSVAN